MARKLPKLNKVQVLFLILTLALMCTIFYLSNEDNTESDQTSYSGHILKASAAESTFKSKLGTLYIGT